MTRFLLVRHGRTAWNAQSRLLGQTDLPLDESGIAQAQALQPLLAAKGKMAAVFSSDLKRCQETAVHAWPHQPATIDKRLRELDFGKQEGLTHAEAQQSGFAPDPRAVEAVCQRVRAFCDDVHGRYPDETVLVFTHGGVIRLLLTLALRLPAQWHASFGVDNGSVTELYWFGNDLPYLHRLNEAA